MSNFLNVIPENLTLGVVILVMTLLAFYKGRKILYVMLISFFPAVMLYQAFTLWNLVTSVLPDGFFGDTFDYRLGLFSILFRGSLVMKLVEGECTKFWILFSCHLGWFLKVSY